MTWPTVRDVAGLRSGLCAMFVATALGCGAAAAVLAPSAASAAPDPCAAGQIAKTVGTVATNTGTYLDSHPQTNQALTTISQQQAGPQTLGALKTYFDANPQAGKDLQAIQQPLAGLSTRCKLPVSLPQLLGLMQAAQSGTLPGAAQSVSAVPTGGGPLPGPATSTGR